MQVVIDTVKMGRDHRDLFAEFGRNACFFGELAQGSVLLSLAGFDVTAGYGPGSDIGRFSPPYKQDIVAAKTDNAYTLMRSFHVWGLCEEMIII